MDIYQKQTIIIALKELFSNPSFSICTIDKCLKIANIIPNNKDYECLSALHCINYSKMPLNYRQEVFNKVIAMFQSISFDFEEIESLMSSNITEIKHPNKSTFIERLKLTLSKK